MGETEADAKCFGLFSKKVASPTGTDAPSIPNLRDDQMTVIDKYADYYDMSHYKRGLALVFNHFSFDNNSPRDGTNKDCTDITNVLEELKFEVKVHHDLKYGEICEVLDDAANANHSQADCLVVVVMTHGDEGVLYARDHQYPPDFLWKSFSGSKCPTLAGKPKLFFIQACRGTDTDAGVEVKMSRTATDASVKYKIPAMADVLVMFSAYNGHFSYRSPTQGSWFIQCLCKELRERADRQDLLTILTFVNRRMAVDFESYTPGKRELHQKKQVGVITSTLTRLVHFYKEEN